MKTGFIKMFRDLRLYKGRTILTLIGVFIGIAAVGAVLSAYAILHREMQRNYMETNPASMVLYIRNLDNNAVKLVRQSRADLNIELRKTVLARLSNGDGTYSAIYLRAIPEFQNLQVDTFTLEKGKFPNGDSEIALERDCFKILRSVPVGNAHGKSLPILLPGGTVKQLRLCGIVHAPGLAPASMENFSYGFVQLQSLRALGYRGWYDEMRIVCHEHRFDRVQMRQLAGNIQRTLWKNGYHISQTDVPVPGKHPHADQLDSLLFLLQAFTAIALLAAGLIIINLLNFIMSKQTRQIAIQKTVGAGAGAIAVPYLGYVFIISAVGFLISIPLSTAAGAGYSYFAAYLLNFKIASYAIPAWVLIAQALTALLIPLAAAAYPVNKSCRRTIKDGLSDNRDSAPGAGENVILKRLIPTVNSKIALPLNYFIRKKGRAGLAVLALAMGGILFMASQNMVASIDRTVAANMKAFRWDYEIKLAGNYPENRITKVLKKIRGLERSEIWMVDTLLLKKPDGAAAANYKVKIMPEGSRMVKFPTAEMLHRENSMMITKAVEAEEPWIKTGMKTGVEIAGQKTTVTIAGITNEIPAMPMVYLGRATYQKYCGAVAPKQLIVARAVVRDMVAQRRIKRLIEAEFQSAGIAIEENVNIYLLRKSFVDHLRVIVAFLTVMAMLAVTVGGVSIASAIGINVAERKREIGVLRAVGVNSRQIIAMVSLEVMMMGLAGWLVGVVLSYPVSIGVGNYFGQIFLHANLENAISAAGLWQWLWLSVLASLLAGIFPAWKVALAPLREMLEYE